MAESLTFPDVLRQAGAVMTQRGGRPAPAHFGSAAGELAVCVAGVGLADRADLAVLSVAASPRCLDLLLARELGHGVAPGGAVPEGGVWWCRPTDDEVLVLLPYSLVARIKPNLKRDVDRLTHGTLTDLSESRCVLNLVGRRVGRVLADLGVAADTSPLADTVVGGHPATWLLESATSALAIVDSAVASDVWQAVKAAGRPHGISCVGLESVDRYRLTLPAGRKLIAVA